MAIGISGSGGSSGPAVSGGGDVNNSANIVFSDATEGGVSTTSSTDSMSLGTWAAIAAAAGLGTFFLVKHKQK